MDNDELFSTVPTLHRWRSMFEQDKKEFTESLIRTIIKGIAKDGREPSTAEARDIWAAIGALAGRNYTVSLDYARQASMAPKERISFTQAGLSDPPSATQLLEALDRVAGRSN